MPKINDYTEETFPKNTIFFLVQTENGTKKVQYSTLMQILLGGNQNG